jgi:hypothetical protein
MARARGELQQTKSEQFHLTDDEIKAHVKAVAVLHLLLHKAPVQALARFKDPGFCMVAEKHQHHPWVVLVKVLLATVITFMMPTLYGFTIMENPCEPKNLVMAEGGFNSSVLKDHGFLSKEHWRLNQKADWADYLPSIGLVEEACDAQEFMKSWKAILITPVMIVFLALFYKVLHCISRSTHAKLECGLKNMMRSEVELMCYGGACDIPPVYNATILGYAGMFIAFAVVAVETEDVVALVMAFALSKLFIAMCTVMLGANQALKERYDAEIQTWLEDSDVVQRLFQNPGPLVWVTQKELRDICELQKDVARRGWPGLLECVLRDQLPISNDTWLILKHGRGSGPLKPCMRSRPYGKIRKRLLATTIYIVDRNISCKLSKGDDVLIEREDKRNDGAQFFDYGNEEDSEISLISQGVA